MTNNLILLKMNAKDCLPWVMFILQVCDATAHPCGDAALPKAMSMICTTWKRDQRETATTFCSTPTITYTAVRRSMVDCTGLLAMGQYDIERSNERNDGNSTVVCCN